VAQSFLLDGQSHPDTEGHLYVRARSSVATRMEVVLLTQSLFTVVVVAAFPAPGRRVQLGLLDAQRQRVGAMDVLHSTMVAPGPLATGTNLPTRPFTGDRL
jgi:hypothetical protein